jgi:hypothetical protein
VDDHGFRCDVALERQAMVHLDCKDLSLATMGVADESFAGVACSATKSLRCFAGGFLEAAGETEPPMEILLS